jgi:excisionase family DNA binding protein
VSDELLTVAQAAARVQVCRRTIYNWLAAGKLQVVTVPSGRLRIVASSLIQPQSGDTNA